VEADGGVVAAADDQLTFCDGLPAHPGDGGGVTLDAVVVHALVERAGHFRGVADQ
jgi:hypothetical protein